MPHLRVPVSSAVQTRAAGFALALVSALGFSLLGILARYVYSEGLSPIQALAWRFSGASVALWAWILVTGRQRTLSPRRAAKLGLLGLGFSLQAGMFFFTLRLLGPAATTLLLYLYPGFVLIFSAIFLKRRAGPIQIVSLALSLSGCVLAFFKPGAYPVAGVALGAFMAAAYGAYLVLSEKVLEREDPLLATAMLMATAAAIYLTLAFASGGLPLPSLKAGLALAGISLAATLLPIASLFASMRRIGASDASLVSTAELPVTVLLAALFLGERLAPAALVGGALVCAGVILIHIGEGRARGKAAD